MPWSEAVPGHRARAGGRVGAQCSGCCGVWGGNPSPAPTPMGLPSCCNTREERNGCGGQWLLAGPGALVPRRSAAGGGASVQPRGEKRCRCRTATGTGAAVRRSLPALPPGLGSLLKVGFRVV